MAVIPAVAPAAASLRGALQESAAIDEAVHVLVEQVEDLLVELQAAR